MLEWIVTSEESELKLIAFLSQRLEGKYSARFLKRLIEQNQCQINGRTERFASTVLGKGDQVSLYLQQPSASSPHQFDSSRILYEDESLFVYDKPAGINCDEKGILSLLKEQIPSLRLVHRLDRETTGVLLLAKQEGVFDKIVDQFKQFQVQKRYRAIVDGLVEHSSGLIENYLGKKQAYAGQTIWGSVPASRGLYACTEWQRLKKGREASMLVCFPKTGRTHQLRVHMAEMGHPILGDFQYGKQFECSYRPSRYLLHAEEIQLFHPLTGELLRLVAPLPDDFKIAQRKLFNG